METVATATTAAAAATAATVATTTPARKKRPKRSTPFNHHHGVMYGLEVVTRNLGDNAVTSIVCCFCKYFGREEKVGQKRKPFTTIKHFKPPFRNESFKQHLVLQHPTKWIEYQDLPKSAKPGFFPATSTIATIDNLFPSTITATTATATTNTPVTVQVARVAPAVGIDSEPTDDADGHRLPTISDALIADINPPIIDVIFRDILSDYTMDATAKTDALAIFKPIYDDGGGENHEGQREMTAYRMEFNDARLFKLVVKFISGGISFRRVARQVRDCREVVGFPFLLEDCSEAKATSIVRAVTAYTLQRLADALSSTWAFSLVFDSATMNDQPTFLDVRVRFVTGTALHSFHLITLPIDGYSTEELVVGVLQKTLDATCPSWRDRVLSIYCDGTQLMTGQIRAIANQVVVEGAPESKIVRFWCGAHQLDLIVEKAMLEFCDGSFYRTLQACIDHIRMNDWMIENLFSRCPQIAEMRWLSLGNVLVWFKTHRPCLSRHFDKDKPKCKPDKKWWVQLLAIIPIMKEIETLFESLRSSKLIESKQQESFSTFLESLRTKFSIFGPIPSSTEEEKEHGGYIRKGDFTMFKSRATGFINVLGSFARTSLDEQGVDATTKLTSDVADIILSLAEGVNNIKPERHQNDLLMKNLPPYLPIQYAKMAPFQFIDLVVLLLPRLKLFYPETYIDDLESEQRRMYDDYKLGQVFCAKLDGMAGVTSFHGGWQSLKSDFPRLCVFASGMATLHPGTSQVVDNTFSAYDWKEEDRSGYPTDFLLEGILHCDQFQRLHELKKDDRLLGRVSEDRIPFDEINRGA